MVTVNFQNMISPLTVIINNKRSLPSLDLSQGKKDASEEDSKEKRSFMSKTQSLTIWSSRLYKRTSSGTEITQSDASEEL